ncbi:MAG: PepSY domain-containing protein [Actinobacteria bacterium]|nr:PepSY domain-containing protein [Actinomycetota bacterium]
MRKRKLYVIAGLVVAGSLAGGGAALATGGEDPQVQGTSADQARSAAVQYLGGGRAGSVEPDGEHGATYDVEVHASDGSVRDVWLDSAFKPITSEIDSEQG